MSKIKKIVITLIIINLIILLYLIVKTIKLTKQEQEIGTVVFKIDENGV